ncbi:MAG: PKD domain-containing protein [Parcubacteria group bacterium]
MRKKLKNFFLFFLIITLYTSVNIIVYSRLTQVNAFSEDVEIVSRSYDGESANNGSYAPDVSADGGYVAFYSGASNLIEGDTNGFADAFVYDRYNESVERVSVSTHGIEGNSHVTGNPSLSADGGYVAFSSSASNLVPEDNNNAPDVFVYNRFNRELEIVSLSNSGELGNGPSSLPQISSDGRYVSFYSDATNLVNGDTNNTLDIFVRDRVSNTTERVSISPDGLYDGASVGPSSISSDGRFVVFSGAFDRNISDVWVRDRHIGTTRLVSVSPNGIRTNMHSHASHRSVSSDGRFIVFRSYASNLISNDYNGWGDVFLKDMDTNQIELVSVSNEGILGNYNSGNPTMDAQGLYVVFESGASNLTSGDNNQYYDVFVRDIQNEVTRLVSYNNLMLSANYGAGGPVISSDGNIIAFVSKSSDIVDNDSNGFDDVFIRIVIPINSVPNADAGLDKLAQEGELVLFSASGTADPDGLEDIVSYEWDFGDGHSASGIIVNHTYADNGVYIATLTVTDVAGASSSDTAIVTVDNLPPSILSINAPFDPIQLGNSINVDATFSDPGIFDTHVAQWNWGDGTISDGVVNESGGTGNVYGDHAYSLTGVYIVTLSVTDNDGGSSNANYQYVVVYDSNQNSAFVTGGGRMQSQQGSYFLDPLSEGTANFGFNSKYQNGAAYPTGQVRFRLPAALTFASTSYDWLVVSGSKAQFKGSGTINGLGNYGFFITVNDDAIGGMSDNLRIKIWDKANGDIIYDNQAGDPDNADALNPIEAGNLVIH